MQILRKGGDAALPREIIAHKRHGANFVHSSHGTKFPRLLQQLFERSLADADAANKGRKANSRDPILGICRGRAIRLTQ